MQQTSPQAYLIIQSGSRWTDILRLPADQPVFVGRSSDNQIVVRDERVSRKHAEISPTTGCWQVRDLGSRNGTQVDESTIDGPHPLSEGETIRVGNCRMTFSYSLTGGFAASHKLGEANPADSMGGQQTVDLGAPPTIVTRRSHSQWSSGNLVAPKRQVLATKAAHTARESDHEKWNFFYRLIFDLVSCESPEQAAQVALDRLLEQLGVSSGGVVTIESAPPDATTTGSRATGYRAASSSTARSKSVAKGTRSETSDTSGKTPRETVEDGSGSLPAMAVLATRQPAGGSYHRVSDFLVTTVVSDQQAVLARNVKDDSQLSLARESARREIVSIICAPLRVRRQDQEQVVGLLHVYSSGNERMLTETDLDLTVGVADNLSIALSRHQANALLSKTLEHSRRKVDQLKEQLELSTAMVGRSKALQKVKQQIQRAAPTTATVLVRGESGVGKELVARAIHEGSQRHDGPLLCLNCAALAPTLLESELFGHEKGAFTGATERKIGKFEAADGGTLLLDEIGEMHPELQAKFLRVLEGQPFERLGGHKPITTDVRVIAATNRDLEAAVKAKEFRADLYYRLRVIEINVPPLRERLDDVPALVELFLNQLRQHAGRRLTGIEPQSLEMLSRHNWPGNVRELRNVIERAVVLGNDSTIGVSDLNLSTLGELPGNETPAASDRPEFSPISLYELEKAHIFAVLDHVGGNKSKASQLLGIERSTLDRKLKRYEG
jgi:transcriptional regulator with GAF, ATPase, and Fis domain